MPESLKRPFDLLMREVGNLASVWTLYQLLLIAACFLMAVFLDRLLAPALESHLRDIHNRPRLLRALVIPLRRLRWILMALMLWATVLVMREITWPSRSYFIWIAASLTTAWVVISVLSRTIRNRSIANIVAIIAWSLAALNIFGVLGKTAQLLDEVGFTVGSSRLSLFVVLKAAALLGLLIWIASVLSRALERRIESVLDVSPTVQVLIGKVVKALLLGAAVFVGLSTVGIDLTALAVFSGALGLGIGFGLQKLASNLMSGFIILLDRSIKPGDVISLGETFGWISSLNARYVSVVTRDGLEHLIPNEDFITQRVVNWTYTDDTVRMEVKFGVAYDSDPHQVRKLAIEAVANLDRVLKYRPPVCHLVSFGESSLDFVLRFWIADPRNGVTNIRGQAMLALWDAFKAHGVRIPYPHREVFVHKMPEAKD